MKWLALFVLVSSVRVEVENDNARLALMTKLRTMASGGPGSLPDFSTLSQDEKAILKAEYTPDAVVGQIMSADSKESANQWIGFGGSMMQLYQGDTDALDKIGDAIKDIKDQWITGSKPEYADDGEDKDDDQDYGDKEDGDKDDDQDYGDKDDGSKGDGNDDKAEAESWTKSDGNDDKAEAESWTKDDDDDGDDDNVGGWWDQAEADEFDIDDDGDDDNKSDDDSKLADKADKLNDEVFNNDETFDDIYREDTEEEKEDDDYYNGVDDETKPSKTLHLISEQMQRLSKHMRTIKDTLIQINNDQEYGRNMGLAGGVGLIETDEDALDFVQLDGGDDTMASGPLATKGRNSKGDLFRADRLDRQRLSKM